ncbi:MAG: glutamine--fructose-6-phosphate transaminase (isomerizing) [Holosporales bacterium]|jgi:glucosamine--fructose-6-phosphate aminotransferase (isomerizing)|nr:glutamine--fructose-6-phosphate transaminase (isomerizing) [Holosporales bacterium]
MCGIVAIASKQNDIADLLLDGLTNLEYRGYDSAGIALLSEQQLWRQRCIGSVKNLRDKLQLPKMNAHFGIAHTRWAVRGGITEANAHPQSDGKTVVVHNGIIENTNDLMKCIPDAIWESQTDTEIVVHLISHFVNKGQSFYEATRNTIKMLVGTFALVILHKNFPNVMIATRKVNPLSIGKMHNIGFFISSDVSMAPVDSFVDLADNEICMISHCDNEFSVKFFDSEDKELPYKIWRKANKITTSSSKGDFADFTLKEINEQPNVIQKCIETLDNGDYKHVSEMMKNKDFINFFGCGSSRYAGLIGKYLYEKFICFTNVTIPSEFNYGYMRNPNESLNFCLSQSGETLDTLRSLEFIIDSRDVVVITNVANSTMSKLAIEHSKPIIDICAGQELSVVSTKAFTAQLAVIVSMLIEFVRLSYSESEAEYLRDKFGEVPKMLKNVLQMNFDVQWLLESSTILFLGRGICYPIALEGALKLKEAAYLHAEGLPAGEMKHGPLALIDEQSVCIALAPGYDNFEKIASNVYEVIARKGKVMLFTDEVGLSQFAESNSDLVKVITLPNCMDVQVAFVYSVAVQLLAYQVAKSRGTNIDRPRNLAKSVTVE